MCDIGKAQKMMNEIDDALGLIHDKLGTPKNFGYFFVSDKTTGDVVGINLRIPIGPEISPKIPPYIKGGHPETIEKQILPELQSLALAEIRL